MYQRKTAPKPRTCLLAALLAVLVLLAPAALAAPHAPADAADSPAWTTVLERLTAGLGGLWEETSSRVAGWVAQEGDDDLGPGTETTLRTHSSDDGGSDISAGLDPVGAK